MKPKIIKYFRKTETSQRATIKYIISILKER